MAQEPILKPEKRADFQMRAYKFRSPSQVAYALDIIFNQRLYCAKPSTLNDPTEGRFAYSHNPRHSSDPKEQVAEIIQEKKQIRICSLSKTFDSHLLWSHYASGFKGLAIEVELPENSLKIRDVNYGGVFAGLNLNQSVSPAEAASYVLTSKFQAWHYEKEVRVLHNSKWFDLENPVGRIIAGHRMNPALFQGLQVISERYGITLNRTGIGDEGIDADHVAPLDD